MNSTGSKLCYCALYHFDKDDLEDSLGQKYGIKTELWKILYFVIK